MTASIRMTSRRFLSLSTAWIAIAVLTWSCAGGSGSSGFGISESVVLQRVADGRQCEDFEGLIICPADATPEDLPTPNQSVSPTPSPIATGIPTAITATPALPQATETPGADDTPAPQATPTEPSEPTATPSPTVIPPSEIFTNLPDPLGQLFCAPNADGRLCDIAFRFAASGFPTDAAFRVAVRDAGSDSPWSILTPSAIDESGSAAFGYSASIAVDLAAEREPNDGNLLRIVVLVFEREPGPVPDRVARLSDTGADRAFVVAPLPILLP